jgi:hypothetical protein
MLASAFSTSEDDVAKQSAWHQPKDENTLFLSENALFGLSMKYVWSSFASRNTC